MAIATGVCDGLNMGLNARAALMTRGLAEMTRLATALGGQANTLLGLTGVGDLILTCTGALSRNRKVGLLLAEGHDLASILTNLGHVAEGVYSAKAALLLAKKHQVRMPITEAVCQLLEGNVDVRTLAKDLMERETQNECQ
jgi:glycerol-3-phosphate dehydrogenase (NAD(P)+)